MKKFFAGLAAAILMVVAMGGAALIGDSVNLNGVSHNIHASVNWNRVQGTVASVNWNGADPNYSVNWN